jgi:bacterioferritin
MQNHGFTDVKTIRERARQHIEQGPLTPGYKADANVVLRMLNTALATELVCTLRYRRHHFAAVGIDAKIVTEEFKRHADATQAHAERIAARIVQLGGGPDFSPQGLATRSRSQYVAGACLFDMLREDLVAERIAIDSYREMIRYLRYDDPSTRRQLEDILAAREAHAHELAGMLAELGDRHAEALIDEALEETFPASDPPAPAV